MELLAGLSLTTKAVERTAEAVGEDIEVRQQGELRRALQLELPIPMGPRIAILYVEMDGTGIPVVHEKPKAASGNRMATRRTRARPSWAAYSPRPRSMKKAILCGTKPRPAM